MESQRLIAWTSTLLPGSGETSNYIIATGIDITERKHLEKAILEISAREQRRIGQDLHDGLGQHLTGIAFMAKVHEAKLAEKNSSESRRRRQDREAGERGDPQDARAGARAASGGLRFAGPDVCLADVGGRGGRPVWSIVPLSVRERRC